MPEWLKNIFGGFNLGSIGQLASSIFSSVANVKMQRETNATNMQIAREQNAAAAAESEKAYERSKATNQVRLMQDAGMSKAGALNAINGGGSYQPAPVNAGQAQAPQIDLTHAFDGIITAAENNKQRKAAEDLQTAQIKAAEEAQRKQIESDERKHAAQLANAKEIAQLQADTTNRNADNRLDFDKSKLDWEKEIYDRLPIYEKERYDLGTELLRNQKDLELWKVNDLKYKVLEYQSLPYKTTRDGENLLRGLAAEFDYNLTEKDMKEFRDTYMYYDKESNQWKYKEHGNNAASRWVYENAPLYWDFVARVLPANKLGDIFGRVFKGK